ncbi:MAG: transcriptional repressor [Gammaproteobacteria bacterium]|jgi:Fur family iron response transcriptional regulator|nr:transcriptional repressor [Gammaproteobacteria bacterium]
MNKPHLPAPKDLEAHLRRHDVTPTQQRRAIAAVLFRECRHLSADEIFAEVNAAEPAVSRATVYNTLGLFVKKGLVREVIADPARSFFDPNTTEHHHFFDTDSGELIDIDADGVQVSGLPTPPEGTRLEGVEVIVRVGRPRD